MVITRCNFFLDVDGPVTGGGRYLIRLAGWGGEVLISSSLWYVVCGMCLTLSGGTEKNIPGNSHSGRPYCHLMLPAKDHLHDIFLGIVEISEQKPPKQSLRKPNAKPPLPRM